MVEKEEERNVPVAPQGQAGRDARPDDESMKNVPPRLSKI